MLQGVRPHQAKEATHDLRDSAETVQPVCGLEENHRFCQMISSRPAALTCLKNILRPVLAWSHWQRFPLLFTYLINFYFVMRKEGQLSEYFDGRTSFCLGSLDGWFLSYKQGAYFKACGSFVENYPFRLRCFWCMTMKLCFGSRLSALISFVSVVTPCFSFCSWVLFSPVVGFARSLYISLVLLRS